MISSIEEPIEQAEMIFDDDSMVTDPKKSTTSGKSQDNNTAQIEGSPKSSSRKRSVNFLTNFMHFHGKFSKEIYF